jgi:hypothetical protein
LKKNKGGLIEKKGKRWGQNRIKKKWDYKYPFLLSHMVGWTTSRNGRDFRFSFMRKHLS